MLTVIGFIIGWVACAVVTYGSLLAYAQREFPWVAVQDWTKDRQVSAIIAVFGPMGLIAALWNTKGMKHGLMFKQEEL